MKNLILLGLVLFLTACNSVPSAESDLSSPDSEADKPLVHYWPSQGQAQIIYENVSEKDPAFSVDYPRITNLLPNHPLLKAVNESYLTAIETFKSEAKLFVDDSEAGIEASASIPWDYSLAWLGGRYAPEMWSLAFQVYSYQGGAHGNHYTDTYNYHPNSNKIITLPSFFQDDSYLEPIVASVRESIIITKTERWETSAQEETYDASLDSNLANTDFNADLLDSWVLSERDKAIGILFFFAPYAVGSYSEGSYEAFVPASVFRDNLRREFVGVFE